MSTDIYWYAEKKNAQGQWEMTCSDYYAAPGIEDDEFTIDRNYRLFHWLGGLERGNFEIAPLAANRGMPEDTSYCEDSDYGLCGHNRLSWVGVEELTQFDYDTHCGELVDVSEQARTLVQGADGVFGLKEPKRLSCREVFGSEWFVFLNKLVASGATRMIFAFD